MPTTYIGRDDLGKALYHVRQADSLTRASMVEGVQDDTLFHSGMQYILCDEYTAGRASDSANGTFRVQLFNIPASVKTAISNGYTVIVNATLTNGRNIPVDLKFRYCYTTVMDGYYPESWYGYPFYVVAGNKDIVGWASHSGYPSNTVIRDVGSGYGAGANGLFNKNILITYSSPGVVGSYNGPASISTYGEYGLTASSNYITYTSNREGAYAELDISYLTFIVTNIISSGDTLSFSNKVPGSGIKITPTGLFINDTDYFNGKRLLRINNRNVSFGGSASGIPTDYKYSIENGLGLDPCFGTYRWYNAHVGKRTTTKSTGVRAVSSNPIVPYCDQSSVGYQLNYCSPSGYSYTGIGNYPLSSLKVDTYSTSPIVTTSGCEMTNDSLSINGVQMFSSGKSGIFLAHAAQTMTFGGISYQQMSSTSNTNEVLGTFTVNKPNSILALLFTVNTYGTGGAFSGSCYLADNNGNSNSYYYSTLYDSISSSYMNANLEFITLDVGQCATIATGTVGGNSHGYKTTGTFSSIEGASGKLYMGSVSYMFYRISTTQVQIIRRTTWQLLNSTSWSADVRQWYEFPALRLNFIQLTSGSVS